MCFWERERVEQCRPGHFIITVRKHSMKLSQGSKEGCLYNIPPLLLSKLALFYILQLKALFSFYIPVAFILPSSHLNVEVFGFPFFLLLFFLFILTLPASSLQCTVFDIKCQTGSSSRCWDSVQEQHHWVLSETKCLYSYRQMSHWRSTRICFPKYLSMQHTTLILLGWKHANGNISWTNMVITLRCFWETGHFCGEKSRVGCVGGLDSLVQ